MLGFMLHLAFVAQLIFSPLCQELPVPLLGLQVWEQRAAVRGGALLSSPSEARHRARRERVNAKTTEHGAKDLCLALALADRSAAALLQLGVGRGHGHGVWQVEWQRLGAGGSCPEACEGRLA